jgi:hypothetical protein
LLCHQLWNGTYWSPITWSPLLGLHIDLFYRRYWLHVFWRISSARNWPGLEVYNEECSGLGKFPSQSSEKWRATTQWKSRRCWTALHFFHASFILGPKHFSADAVAADYGPLKKHSCPRLFHFLFSVFF